MSGSNSSAGPAEPVVVDGMCVPDVAVCDLDGTLLRSDATLSPFACDALNRLIDGGMGLTVASGRSSQAIRALMQGVRIELPVIELNGAFITELRSGRHLAVRALAAHVARAVIEALDDHGASPVLTSWDGQHDRVRYTTGANPGSDYWVAEKRAYGDPRLHQTRELRSATDNEQAIMITGFVENAAADRLLTRLAQDLGNQVMVHAAPHIYYTGWTEFQIQHPDAEKGRAVPELLALAGLPAARVIACGDHVNDLGMFAVADETVAPANAHPLALEAAANIAGVNDEDGVVRWLLERTTRAVAATGPSLPSAGVVAP